jgi:hypothetical protein
VQCFCTRFARVVRMREGSCMVNADRASNTTTKHVCGVGYKHVCGVGYSNRYHSWDMKNQDFFVSAIASRYQK